MLPFSVPLRVLRGQKVLKFFASLRAPSRINKGVAVLRILPCPPRTRKVLKFSVPSASAADKKGVEVLRAPPCPPWTKLFLASLRAPSRIKKPLPFSAPYQQTKQGKPTSSW